MEQTKSKYVVETLDKIDKSWFSDFLCEHWGSTKIVARGRVHYAEKLNGFVALDGTEKCGVLTYKIEGKSCEIVTLNSIIQRKGIGSALIEAVKKECRIMGVKRLWLITTNNNLRALEFYQRRGFHFSAVYPGAVELARMLKPEIPQIAPNGIEIRDEIELDFMF